MSLASSNSSSDSLSHQHQHSYQQHYPRSFTPNSSNSSNSSVSNKPRTLSEEISFAAQSSSSVDDIHRSNSNKHPYPSPITPSDLLSIPDLSASPSSASSSSSATSLPSPFPLQRTRVDSGMGQKLRPSPLSINTNISNNSAPVLDTSAFSFAASQQHQSPSSVSRGSTTVLEGGGLGSPCANLTMSTSSGHQSREHHPSCHLHGSPSRIHHRDSKSEKIPSKGVLRFEDPLTPNGHEGIESMNVSSSSLIDEAVVAALPEPTPLLLDEIPLAIEKAPASTAVTIVGSTPTYGMGTYKAQREQEEAAAESALGLYSPNAEPPKKRQRSAAAVLFGAAFETVIFTSAVALSAYQLLTGRGRQQSVTDTSLGTERETASAEGNIDASSADHTIMPIESAPVNIPTRTSRHHSNSGHAHLLGKSLHHHRHHGRHHGNGKMRHPKSGIRRQHGLSVSLPHSNPHEPDHPFYERAMIPPKRPNTGTEDNDPQFLRMEAQLTTLIAEGKRALSSRIQDHQ
ncbi:hypothetical protein FBU30_010007 [Linnemannia zychae]|nr:hypothetical protein FBU30_010007 [Linnemannia zychae]